MDIVIHISVGGKEIAISRDAVVKKLKGVRLGEVRTHAVLVEGVLHPGR